MIYIKQHSTPKGIILAMCDEELLGRVVKDGKIELDLDTYSNFYKGELVSEEESKERIDENFFSINAVGSRSVKILIDKGLIKAEEIRRIGKIESVHIYRVV